MATSKDGMLALLLGNGFWGCILSQLSGIASVANVGSQRLSFIVEIKKIFVGGDMAMQAVNKYILYINEQPAKVGQSLEEMQEIAASHSDRIKPMRIESHVAPAQSKIWIYDHDLDAWIEQK